MVKTCRFPVGLGLLKSLNKVLGAAETEYKVISVKKVKGEWVVKLGKRKLKTGRVKATRISGS